MNSRRAGLRGRPFSFSLAHVPLSNDPSFQAWRPLCVGMPLTLRAQSTTSAAESTSSSLPQQFQGQFVKITLNDGVGQLLDARNLLVDWPTSIPLGATWRLKSWNVRGKNLMPSHPVLFCPLGHAASSQIQRGTSGFGFSNEFTMIGFLGVDRQSRMESWRKDQRQLRRSRFFWRTGQTLGLGLHQRDSGRRQQEHHLQCGVHQRGIRA